VRLRGQSPQSHYALAIDLGTGGPKVGLVSLTGRTAWREHLPVQSRYGSDGAVEQDAEEWWQLIVAAAQRGLRSGAVDPADVAAVAVTGQWSSRVPVDERGNPVAPCVMWTDTRGHAHGKALVGGRVAGFNARRALRWVRRSGGAPSPTGADPLSHMLYLERDCPHVADRARWFLEPVDYLTMRFTGRATASPASMLATWLIDTRRLERAPEYDAALVQMAQIDADKLPPLVPTGSVIGPVLDEVAAQLGLPGDVQVTTGVPDLHAATVGSGALSRHASHLAISTSGWISCPYDRKKTDLRHSMATVPGIGDGRYVIANSIDSAGVCLELARAQLFDPPPPWEELFALAGKAKPGSGGVVFAPWPAGTRSPVDDRGARAGWHNISLSSTRAELVRAVLEGVACHARWLHDAMERFVGERLEPVRVIGGGARSDLWCQITADALDRRVERVADPTDAALRGAALFAGIGLGAIAQHDVPALVEVDRVFEPDPATRSVYRRLRAELPRLYRAQRGRSARLGDQR
jgi:xylulokinase